ncbi:Myb protein [Eumeta japonica]|uniref:Myb protein n=1 Tax=Eumeta variegata TaxID=151549 RepID=A0A4C1TAD6_EUMVA|nr:Myb protein [Eumeta japonica]
MRTKESAESAESDSSDVDNKCSTGGFGKRWSKSEDNLLKRLVEQFADRWDLIAPYFKDRTEPQVQQRWAKVLNPELIKGPWTKEEDEKFDWTSYTDSFKNALAALGKKHRGERYIPPSPSSLVEDLAEIIHDEQLNDTNQSNIVAGKKNIPVYTSKTLSKPSGVNTSSGQLPPPQKKARKSLITSWGENNANQQLFQ